MWRSKIFWRMFGVYSVLWAISLALLGWLLLGRMETHLLDGIRERLETKARLIEELVARPGQEELQATMTRLGQETHARITLIAADGAVLADSDEQPQRMDNHLERIEVQRAAGAGIGVSTRYSNTVRQTMMYLARRSDAGPVRFVRVALPLGAVEAEIRWLHGVVWTAATVTLVLAVILSLLIARRITAPLVELADAARSISQGSYGRKVHIAARDEIGTLAQSFNEMSQACAAHIAQMDRDREQLRAIFRSMVEGVLVLDADATIQFINEAASELLGAPMAAVRGRKVWQAFRHRQLGEAVEKILASAEPHQSEIEWSGPDRKVFAVHCAPLPGETLRGAVLVFHDITHLRKLERVRREFVANVSHELKTPLAAIQALVETLLDGALQDPEHNVRFLGRIRENADRLHRLVQDLLSLGRIEAGQEVLEIQPLAVDAGVEACLARHGERARGKGLRLEAAPPTEAVIVLADEEALAEILDNLVDNAINYTPAGGAITLRWSGENGEAVLHVEDTGAGIPEKDLPRIFERFYRVDKARSRELGGTGLGLSIVKHLAGALGGSISAVSQVGKGSKFTVRLPRSTSA